MIEFLTNIILTISQPIDKRNAIYESEMHFSSICIPEAKKWNKPN